LQSPNNENVTVIFCGKSDIKHIPMYLVVINLVVGLTVRRSSFKCSYEYFNMEKLHYRQFGLLSATITVTRWQAGYMRNHPSIPSREKRFVPLQNIQTSCKALFDVYQWLFAWGQWHTLWYWPPESKLHPSAKVYYCNASTIAILMQHLVPYLWFENISP
jgi:hypothetical protein